MNDNIIEIVSFLIQRMLNDEDILLEEEEIIEELLGLGYNIQDIDQAFELIYNGTDIIEAENIQFDDLEKIPYYNRIFTTAEKLYLPLDIQGLIIKIMFSKLLTTRENEEIIIKAIQNSYTGYVSPNNLWNIVEDVVKDQRKLDLISHQISEFNDIIPEDNKYIN
ncbi:MAG: DUF494 family protein [Halanaerobiales bacterium]